MPGMLLLEMGSPDDSISVSLLTEFLAEYYTGCEGQDVLTDPDYRAMVGPIEAASGGSVPLRPVYELLGSTKGGR